MKKIMLVFGTRPEAIKMCPLLKELQKREGFLTRVCVTGQHREMLDGVLSAFGIVPDHDLCVMKAGQSLREVTAAVLDRLTPYLTEERPDLVLVHGDTTSAFAAALACFYLHIPVGHVEAGLRTYDFENPYPEEFNRQAISLVARYHFSPTEHSRENLLREGRDSSRVFVTGNTGLDALKSTVREDYAHPLLSWGQGGCLVLLTAHRRENLGEAMRAIFRAVRRVCQTHADVRVVYPVHMNPRVREIAQAELEGCENIRLTEPLDVLDFHNLLARCDFVLTDSGGIQEEAAALGRPVLVMRERTERQEGVDTGAITLIGTEEEDVYRRVCGLLDDRTLYESMAKAKNPYGDGRASQRIADILERELCP